MRRLTADHKRKISQALLGKSKRPLTAVHRRKISAAMIGKRVGERHPMWKGGVSKSKEYRYAWTKQWRQRNPERVRYLHARWQLQKVETLAGRSRPTNCDICRSARGTMHFDHSHQTGQFRGWICRRCNRVLGFVQDDPALLQKLITYLKTHTKL